MEERFCKPKNDTGPTRFLYVAGVGDELHSDVDKLVLFFSRFGALDDRYVSCSGNCSIDDTGVGYSNIRNAIYMIPNRRYVYVCYLSAQSATTALSYIRTQRDLQSDDIGVNKLCANYAEQRADIISMRNAHLECSSVTAHMDVPGCYLIKEFINLEEERQLLSELAGEDAAWRGDINRRVQVSCIIIFIINVTAAQTTYH